MFLFSGTSSAGFIEEIGKSVQKRSGQDPDSRAAKNARQTVSELLRGEDINYDIYTEEYRNTNKSRPSTSRSSGGNNVSPNTKRYGDEGVRVIDCRGKLNNSYMLNQCKKLGDSEALRRAGVMHYNAENGVVRDIKKAKELIKRSVDLGNKRAVVSYAWVTRYEDEYDHSESARYFEICAEDGNLECMKELSVIYVSDNLERALYWAEKSGNTDEISRVKSLVELKRSGAQDYNKQLNNNVELKVIRYSDGSKYNDGNGRVRSKVELHVPGGKYILPEYGNGYTSSDSYRNAWLYDANKDGALDVLLYYVQSGRVRARMQHDHTVAVFISDNDDDYVYAGFAIIDSHWREGMPDSKTFETVKDALSNHAYYSKYFVGKKHSEYKPGHHYDVSGNQVEGLRYGEFVSTNDTEVVSDIDGYIDSSSGNPNLMLFAVLGGVVCLLVLYTAFRYRSS
jgi:hypothetical protein